MQHTCIIIAGPTASGKTGLALELAEHLHTSIISADSRQCYKELHIGVAKPVPEELARVHHYFVNTHQIQENVSAADFEKYALQHAQEIFTQNQYCVMAGGTGLYLKAFAQGLDEIAAVNDGLRQELTSRYETNGLAWLQQLVQEKDPSFAASGEMQNPRRMLRALEVQISTGCSITSFQQKAPLIRPFRMLKFALSLPRALLYERINQRVDSMIAEGLEAEARNLLPYRDLNALQTVGYQEMFQYFDGNCSLAEAIEKIKQHTRHYAKRQMTWFSKDPEIVWVTPQNALDAIKEALVQPA